MSLSRIRKSGISIQNTPPKSRSVSQNSEVPGNLITSSRQLNNFDANSILVNKTSSTYSITIPNDTVLKMDVGATISLFCESTGDLSIVAASGVTLNGSLTLVKQATPVTLLKTASNTWTAYGGSFNPNVATGGTVTDVAGYNGTNQTWRVHTFTSNGTFSITSSISNFRYLIVAGGGGGSGCEGNNAQGIVGGAGGAGGIIENTGKILPVGNMAVTVGGAGGGSCGGPGGTGGSSSFDSQTANGGGHGGGHWACGGGSGGSGGGGRSWNEGNCGGGGGTSYQGHNGAGGCGNGCCASGGGANVFEASTSHKTGGRSSNVTGPSVTYSPGAYGSGGGCGNWNSSGGTGGQGAVIIAYRIG